MSNKLIKIALLTSCSVTRNFAPQIRIQDAPVFGTMNELCEWWAGQWRAAAKDKSILKTPGELYAGVSFTSITEIAQVIGHDNIYIITGGAGMCKHTTKIVPYDFTSSRNEEHNAHQHVVGEKFLPHVWWNKVNAALHNRTNPVAELLNTYDVVITALPKAFMKYIIDDLKSVDPDVLRNRVFMPLPRSMMGSFPKSIHEALVPFDAEYTADLTYSRYDKAQKIAWRFINRCTSLEDVQAYANEVRSTALNLDSTTGTQIDYDELFTAHPEMVQAENVAIALRHAKALGIKVGSKMQFAGAWRGAKGSLEVEVDEDTESRSMAALQSLLIKPVSSTPYQNDELLRQIAIFVKTVKHLQKPEAPIAFQAADIAAWGRQMYPDGGDIVRTGKVKYALKCHAKYLGLKEQNDSGIAFYQVE